MKKYLLNKKTGRNFCDDLWAKIVQIRHDNKCPICLSAGLPLEDKMLNAHHLISRRVFKYRWDTNNGILLCPKHHEFDLELSAHTAPWGFEEWMMEHNKDQYEIWKINRKNIKSDDVILYDQIYYDLEEEYKKLTGSYYMIKRINMYLLSLKKSEILIDKNMGDKTLKDLSTKYNVTETTMKKFLSSV